MRNMESIKEIVNRLVEIGKRVEIGGYHCLCVCKIKDVEFTDNVFSYNSEHNYSTNLTCKKCNHYVVIRYAQNVKVQVME